MLVDMLFQLNHEILIPCIRAVLRFLSSVLLFARILFVSSVLLILMLLWFIWRLDWSTWCQGYWKAWVVLVLRLLHFGKWRRHVWQIDLLGIYLLELDILLYDWGLARSLTHFPTNVIVEETVAVAVVYNNWAALVAACMRWVKEKVTSVLWTGILLERVLSCLRVGAVFNLLALLCQSLTAIRWLGKPLWLVSVDIGHLGWGWNWIKGLIVLERGRLDRLVVLLRARHIGLAYSFLEVFIRLALFNCTFGVLLAHGSGLGRLCLVSLRNGVEDILFVGVLPVRRFLELGWWWWGWLDWRSSLLSCVTVIGLFDIDRAHKTCYVGCCNLLKDLWSPRAWLCLFFWLWRWVNYWGLRCGYKWNLDLVLTWCRSYDFSDRALLLLDSWEG